MSPEIYLSVRCLLLLIKKKKKKILVYSIDLVHKLQSSTSLTLFKSLLRADEGITSDMGVSLPGPPSSSHFYCKESDCLITVKKRKLKPWNQRARKNS